MRRFVGAAAVLSAVIGLALTSGAAMTQTPPAPPADGRIAIAYTEPVNPEHRPIYERLKQRQVLEQLRQFLAPLKLPRQLKVQMRGCRGSVNAWYSNGEVTICYEYVAWIETLAPKQDTPEVTRADAVAGPFIQVVLHEVAHAVFDILQIPLFGREEDAADQLAAFIMLQFGKEVARRTLTGTAHLYRRDAEANAPTEDDFSDVHGTAAQRFYNTLCIAYGGDPNTFNDFVQRKILPKFRADTCAREYRQVLDAFRRLIGPYVDQELMEKVRGMQILRADDGRLDAPGGPQR
jgi:Putative metallopeptidase